MGVHGEYIWKALEVHGESKMYHNNKKESAEALIYVICLKSFNVPYSLVGFDTSILCSFLSLSLVKLQAFKLKSIHI